MIKLSNIAYMSIKHSLHVCWPPTSRTSRHNGQYLLPAAATLLLSHNLCHTEQFLNGSGKLEIPQCTPNTVSSSIFPASCDVNITNSKMLLRGDVQWGHWSWAGLGSRRGMGIMGHISHVGIVYILVQISANSIESFIWNVQPGPVLRKRKTGRLVNTRWPRDRRLLHANKTIPPR